MRPISLYSALRYFPLSSLRSMPIPQVSINSVTSQATRVGPQTAYVCIRGTAHDGHDDIKKAVKNKAAVIFLQDETYCHLCQTVPYVLVRNTREVLSYLAFALYDIAPNDFTVIGVTGTNGKTSVAFYLTQILRKSGLRCAMLSTVVDDIDGQCFPATHTTPPPQELAKRFAQCKRRGIRYIVMEVSSHALEQARVAAIDYTLGIFTNLTEDHLDYHGDMEHYFAAKAHLFTQCKYALLNADDPAAKRMSSFTPHGAVVRFYSAEGTRESDFAALQRDKEANCYYLLGGHAFFPVKLPTIGAFTVSNTLAALSAALMLHIPYTQIEAAAKELHAPSGRMEPIHTRKGVVAYIDYAHTPDALEKALRALRDSLPQKKIHVLFGCGGDRETQKRAQMGAIASKLADYCVITSDNSRSEDPGEIISQILEGFDLQCPHRVIVGRQCAIHHLLEHAGDDTVLLLAGKGHENYEIDQTGKHPFSEKKILAWYDASIHTSDQSTS